MKIAIIVAIDSANGIGKNNDQLAYISSDLKRFKNLTTGHTIIMGRKTFEALPKGALPNRRNVVISRQANYIAAGAEVVSSVEQALRLCANDDRVFVIGGGEIYRLMLPQADELYITRILHSFEGVDTFFPAIEPQFWRSINEEGPFEDEKTQLSYIYSDLVRK